MKNQIRAILIAILLTSVTTSSAMAFDGRFQNRGTGALSIGDLHSGYSGFGGGYGSRRDRNFDGIRGFSSWRHGGWGSRRFDGGYRNYD